ncbi:hypothetical protein HMPREF1624_03626 [Sporothrix schenckii ATCC 58251]|uniref:Uncharacterized protein n=1 Tax=Sporothrix schenckii (strain ATCC 58251 / de Perez 2211183) TaxID=1391915 RepID=U7PZS8_SPOS1|nr:hypothetical protein HMPREF1624_03626 [Sporothrix schenckii ATCC 58251]
MDPTPPEPPSRSLKGRVAVVTGAGCIGDGIGNGRAISILLADDGCDVVCMDRNLAWAQTTVDKVNAGRADGTPRPGRAVACQGNVTLEDDCRAAVQHALDTFGRLDILVNNVGVAGAPGTAVDVDLEQWAATLDVNVSSMVRMAKYAVPAMARNGHEEGNGVIVNMGSVAGLRGGTPHLLYPTSKGAVVNMTRAMAAHHAAAGIRVNCVCPGMLYTPMMYAAPAEDASESTKVIMSEEARSARKARSLLGTEGTAWDCACAVVFLSSDHARWITGAIIPVDAGVTAAVGIGMPKSASVNGK